MVTCPVCEHSQAEGTACEQCGRSLVPWRPSAVAVLQALSDLETTRHPGASLPVAVERLAGLEATRVPSGPDLPAQGVPDLEPTREGPVHGAPVHAPPVPGLDTGRHEAVPSAPTPAPQDAVTCRYCRHVQAQGLLCDRCGMRLPRLRAAGQQPGAAASRAEGGGWVACPRCHSQGRPGRACAVCQTMLRGEE